MTTAPPLPPVPPSPPSPPRPPEPLQPFRYEAQTVDGRTFSGTLDAKSTAEAQAGLELLQLRVLSIEPAPPVAGAKRQGMLGRDDFELFNQQLAYLTSAGLPVERGLRLIASDLRTGRLARAASDVAEELERGTPLKEAFDKHASRFPPLYARLVDAGVNSGNLPAMLFNLGRHLELVARLRQAIWRVVAYPLMVLAVMSVVFFFISMYVLPQFDNMYESFKLPLPMMTSAFLSVGRIYPLVFFGLVGIALLIGVMATVLRMRGHGGAFVDSILVRIPLIGRVIRVSLLSRWIDALRLGVDAGLDMPRALSLASESSGSPRLAKEGNALAELVRSGGSLTNARDGQRGGLIPFTVPAAMELGMNSGDLSATLATLSRMYEQQAEQRLRVLPAILTPVLMLVIAGSISFAIASLFLPILQYIRALSSTGEF